MLWKAEDLEDTNSNSLSPKGGNYKKKNNMEAI
jgi:hypothetical protein